MAPSHAVPDKNKPPPKRPATPRPEIYLGTPGPDGYYGSGWDDLNLIWPKRPPSAPPLEEEEEADESGGQPGPGAG